LTRQWLNSKTICLIIIIMTEIGFQYDWGNKTGSIRYTRVFSPRLFSNFWITGSRFSSNFQFPDYHVEERNVINDLTFKGNLEYHHATNFSMKFGFEQKNMMMRYQQLGAENDIDIHMTPRHYIGYFQTTWRPSVRWEIETGLRYNLFSNDTTFQNLEPRFSMKYRATDKINFKATTGIYHQYLHRIPRFIMADIWSASNQYQDGAKAVHYTCAFQQDLDDDYELEVELFHKTYQNIFIFNPTIDADITADEFTSDGRPKYTKTDGIFRRGDGKTTGMEFLLRKDVGRATGWIGCSFSKTKHTFERINQGKSFIPRHDRTLTLNAVTNINLSKVPGKWLFGLNFIYATGQPYTEPGSAYIIASSPVEPGRAVRYAPTQINNIRFPAYIRMDLSLTYTKKFKNWSIAPYVQVFNIGDRKNVWFVDYSFSWGLPQIEEQYMLPILPTIGVKMKF